MALLRKLFARKAMDGLSCISERVYVSNSCLSMEPLDDDARKDHLISTVIQLKSCHPHDASLMLLNLFAGKSSLLPVDALLQRGVTAIADHPCHRHAPSLPLAMTLALLGTCVDWLVTDGQRNVLLMHCDNGAWPTLALTMAILLVCIEEPAPELETTLATVYGRAPVSLLAAGSALDPQASHLRYLQYVTRLRGSLRGMTMHEPLLILDCLILRAVPDFDGNGGCRPIVRVHGRRDGDDDASPKILFSTPRIKQQFRRYNQVKSAVIKANIDCQVRGDVVVDCTHVSENTGDEEAMFRIMFNTCFVESNMMMLTRDDIDLPWNCTRERFQEDFKIEVFFSEVDVSDIDSHTEEMLGDENAEEFYDFDEISINSGSNLQYHEQHGEDGESKSSDTASGTSEEKRSNSGGNEVRFIPEDDVTRESKDSLEETGNLQDESSDAIRSTLLTSEDPNPEATELQEKRSERTEEGVIHQVEEASIQEGTTNSVRTEVSHNSMAGIGALKPQPKRRAWQNLSKQSAIPIIKKKAKKPDIGSDIKKPSKGKTLLKQTLQKGILIATSSCKNSTVEANTGSIPRKQHENAIKSKHRTVQETKTPTLYKTNVENSSHQVPGDKMARKDDARENTTEPKPATMTIEIPPSPTRPPSQGLNQGSKDSLIPIETAMKPPTHASGNSTTREPKQEVTMASTEVPRQKMVLKKSLSSSAITRTLTVTSSSSPKRSKMTSFPSMQPSSVLLKVASSSSPRARASPSPPRRLPIVSFKVNRTASATQPVMQPTARMPRRASSGESICSSSSMNDQSLSPRASRTKMNDPIGMKDSSRSLSPLSPRLARAQQLSPGTCMAATTASRSRAGATSNGAALPRPTRLSS